MRFSHSRAIGPVIVLELSLIICSHLAASPLKQALRIAPLVLLTVLTVANYIVKSVEMAMCIMIFSTIDSVMRLLQPANTAQEAAAANKVNFFIVGSLN